MHYPLCDFQPLLIIGKTNIDFYGRCNILLAIILFCIVNFFRYYYQLFLSIMKKSNLMIKWMIENRNDWWNYLNRYQINCGLQIFIWCYNTQFSFSQEFYICVKKNIVLSCINEGRFTHLNKSICKQGIWISTPINSLKNKSFLGTNVHLFDPYNVFDIIEL